MDTTKIYLELSPEDEELLNTNNLTISDIINEAGIDGEVEYGVLPFSYENEARTKDIIPIILAASFSVVAISYAITKVLSIIYNRPRLVKIYENELIKDHKGKLLLDKEGKPQYRQVEKYQLLVVKDEKIENLEFSSNLSDGIVLKISSDTNQK